MTVETVRVRFVCLGDICRSPTAEGVSWRLVHERASGETWTDKCTRHAVCVVGGHADRRFDPPSSLLPEPPL